MNSLSRAPIWGLLLIATFVGAFTFQPEPLISPEPTTDYLMIPHEEGDLLIDLKDNSKMEYAGGEKIEWVDTTHKIGHIHTLDMNRTQHMIYQFDADQVEIVEPDLQVQMYEFPNDPLYGKQWHLKAMGAPSGWANTPMGKGVVVAVLDTGVEPSLVDLKDTKMVPGKDFTGEGDTRDYNGHGSHVSGTIAQATNNNIGTAGIAPMTSIMPVKVLNGGGSGSMSGVAAGIMWAADNGAQVINMSLGSSQQSREIDKACQYAHDKGVVVIAAAGNSGREGVGYPGASPGVIGVSATGPDGVLAPYSSWGKGVDISAPGGNKTIKDGGVWQNTLLDGDPASEDYYEFQGTSMASPHVAGAAAILFGTGMTAEAVETTLLGSAKGDGEWNPKYGFGQLDLASALANTTYGWEGTIEQLLLTLVMAALCVTATGTSNRFRLTSGVCAALVANGLFFLPFLPITIPGFLLFLSEGVLTWPRYFDAFWGTNPLVVSALVPAILVFFLGPLQRLRWIAAGVSVGFAAQLLYGAVSGSLVVSLLPGFLTVPWLVANAIAGVFLTLTVVGLEKTEKKQ